MKLTGVFALILALHELLSDNLSTGLADHTPNTCIVCTPEAFSEDEVSIAANKRGSGERKGRDGMRQNEKKRTGNEREIKRALPLFSLLHSLLFSSLPFLCTLPYLPYPPVPYATLRNIALPYVTLPSPSLPFSFLSFAFLSSLMFSFLSLKVLYCT